MRKFYILLCLTMVGVGGAGPAFARVGEGVTVGGSTTVSATTGSQTALSVGWGTNATNAAGAIGNSSVGGSASARASVNTQLALAIGGGSRARTMVGTIKDVDTPGSIAVSGSARQILALSFMPGSSTCAAVGSAGAGGRSTSGSAGSVIAFNFGFLRRSRVRVGTSGLVC